MGANHRERTIAMSLWRKLVQAVQTWRRRRGVERSPKRAGVTLEQLGHRQLLSVNFTGNVFTDFPGTVTPGVAIITDNSPASHPTDSLPPDLSPFIEHTGWDIDAIRLVYDPTNDTLDVGIQQPVNTATPPPGALPSIFGNPVIAGDADDNGSAGSVNPNVQAARPTFLEFPGLQGSDTMGISLDLNNNGTPDVFAGIAGDPNGLKTYQVAQASGNPSQLFGATLPQFTGNAHLQNDSQHGAFEFEITHFSQLFQLETGTPLTAQSIIRVGGFAGSANDTGIGEADFVAQPVNLGLGPVITPPMVCPPQTPMIYVNVHENNHINTAHPELIRVTILGNSGFDVNKIEPNTVSLGGASPIAHFFRDANHDGFLDETFVFRGTDIKLPPGFTQATVTGKIDNGPNGAAEPFTSSVPVFNRDASFYRQAALSAASARRTRASESVPRFLAGDAVHATSATTSVQPTPTVQIPRPKLQPTVHIPMQAAVKPSPAGTVTQAKTPTRRTSQSKHAPIRMRVSDSAAKSMATPY
jgi:hypothetical protein